MIRHIVSVRSKYHIGLQRKDKDYTFLHWLDHGTKTSRFKWLNYTLVLKQYPAIGPTSLVEWNE